MHQTTPIRVPRTSGLRRWARSAQRFISQPFPDSHASSQTSPHQAPHSPFSSQFPSHHAHSDLKDPCPIPVVQDNALQLNRGPASSPLRLPRPLGDPHLISPFFGFLPRIDSGLGRNCYEPFRSPVSMSAPARPLHPDTCPPISSSRASGRQAVLRHWSFTGPTLPTSETGSSPSTPTCPMPTLLQPPPARSFVPLTPPCL